MPEDLFSSNSKRRSGSYSAKDIEVLEGLEPVRRRPGMYIGGTDERALHHLAAEVLDNAMDEAVEGHASRIEVELGADGFVTVRDNGRGIPVDPHPKFKSKSALEVIMTMLHSGAKFSSKNYATSGGLHGVGISVVSALSDELVVEVARDRRHYRQNYSRGKPMGKLKDLGEVSNRRGTMIRFHPDPQIFADKIGFRPALLYRMARSKAYLFRGVEIRWTCDPKLIKTGDDTPAKDQLHFPGGLKDYLAFTMNSRPTVTPDAFAGRVSATDGGRLRPAAADGRPSRDDTRDDIGRVEWAICWPQDDEGFVSSYCNTIPTPQGGSHETALRSALARGLRNYAEMTGNKKAGQITAEDVVGGACVMLSVFIHDPQFQGQTKERLTSPQTAKLVEGPLRDHFELWLSADPASANDLLERVLERADERQRRRSSKDLARKSATRKLRLPGKLADCSKGSSEGTEVFLVEGDSAGGSAKQARDRATQAVLPLRGKILNVASASADKLNNNQEIADLIQALGCGRRSDYDGNKLRYDRVIIMTDADVDGAHIASLLMTFFYREMPGLVQEGRLYLAMPPLYRLTQGSTTVYARDDAHKEELIKSALKGRAKVEISRFKGLGEMPPAQLKETTMNPATRTLLQVRLPDADEKERTRDTARLVEGLMGRKPEKRFEYIQENAQFVRDLDV